MLHARDHYWALIIHRFRILVVGKVRDLKFSPKLISKNLSPEWENLLSSTMHSASIKL